MEMFQFGAGVLVPSFVLGGVAREVGQWALHVQGAWRIEAGDRVVVASDDVTRPATVGDGRPFDADVSGSSLRDVLLGEFARDHPIVTDASTWAGISESSVLFDTGAVLRLAREAPSRRSARDELWRLFQPGAGSRHVVMTASGIRHA
jgi:hypothetical protein